MEEGSVPDPHGSAIPNPLEASDSASTQAVQIGDAEETQALVPAGAETVNSGNTDSKRNRDLFCSSSSLGTGE